MESLGTYFKKVDTRFDYAILEEYDRSYTIIFPNRDYRGFICVSLFGKKIDVDAKVNKIIRNVDVI